MKPIIQKPGHRVEPPQKRSKSLNSTTDYENDSPPKKRLRQIVTVSKKDLESNDSDTSEDISDKYDTPLINFVSVNDDSIKSQASVNESDSLKSTESELNKSSSLNTNDNHMIKRFMIVRK